MTAIPPSLPVICETLIALQRQVAVVTRSRIMQENRLLAVVAITLGYTSGQDEDERKRGYEEARKLIATLREKKKEHAYKPIIEATHVSIDAFNELIKGWTKDMERLVKQLPIRSWLEHPDQKGFGLFSCGKVIGEAGNLANYTNPTALWTRMGLVAMTFDGETKAGSTWLKRSATKLPAELWVKLGYNPRRRSLMYLIGEGLIKQNGKGPYRRRYLDAKRRFLEAHPELELNPCSKCKGKGDASCTSCEGYGKTCKRANLHAMMMATKLLLKNLWLEWNGHPPHPQQNWMK